MTAASWICKRCHRLLPVDGARMCAACIVVRANEERRRPAAASDAPPEIQLSWECGE